MTAGLSDKTGAPAPAQAPQGHPAWRHAVELGPVITGAVFAAGAAAAMARVPVLAAAVIAAAAAISVAAAAVAMARSGAGAAWTASAGACAAGWLAYAAVAGPWSWPAACGLIVPAVVLIPLWPAVRAREARLEDAERRRQAAAAAAAAGARRWPELLARVGLKGVTLTSRADTLCGYAVRLRLPASGHITYGRLAAAAERLEVAARMRHGSLRFERGEVAHEVILHVAERDVLAETIPLPVSARFLTINDPIPVGLYEDGSVCAVTLREVAALIVGLRGAGKSNLAHVLIAQLARCVDVLIFVIDLKGGRMARPWLEPWLAGQTHRPVIDWVATTRDEAEIMLQALLRGVDARSRSGAGGDKLIPSARQPAVILLVDEAAVLLGMGTGGPRTSIDGTTNRQLAELMTQLTITGRSEAIDPVLAVQRGTVTMTGSGDLKSQCGLRIGLGVATEADARLVIPDDIHIQADLARLTHPGSGIVQVRHGRAMPVKFYRIEHADIAPVAARMGAIRPAPDPVLAGALGIEYEQRWSHRAGYLAGATPSRPAVVAPPGTSVSEFERIVAGLADVDRAADAGAADEAAHPGRRRMREFVRRSPRGVTPKMIVDLLERERLGVTRQTVQRWLAEDEAAGIVEAVSFGRWRGKGGQ